MNPISEDQKVIEQAGRSEAMERINLLTVVDGLRYRAIIVGCKSQGYCGVSLSFIHSGVSSTGATGSEPLAAGQSTPKRGYLWYGLAMHNVILRHLSMERVNHRVRSNARRHLVACITSRVVCTQHVDPRCEQLTPKGPRGLVFLMMFN